MKKNLTSRIEFRTILKDIIFCLQGHLNKPALVPLTPEEMQFWLNEITLDDIRVVLSDSNPGSTATTAEAD